MLLLGSGYNNLYRIWLYRGRITFIESGHIGGKLTFLGFDNNLLMIDQLNRHFPKKKRSCMLKNITYFYWTYLV